MIEQAKFSYSPLGKAFEKQTKTIKDQGEKQIEAIEDNKKQLTDINDDYKNKLLLSKEREIFKNIYNERIDKIEELNKIIHYNILKILTPKQMLQRLPIALAQIKACNNSESLLNEIRQIVYSLYQSKQITKKVYNNIIKSIKV